MYRNSNDFVEEFGDDLKPIIPQLKKFVLTPAQLITLNTTTSITLLPALSESFYYVEYVLWHRKAGAAFGAGTATGFQTQWGTGAGVAPNALSQSLIGLTATTKFSVYSVGSGNGGTPIFASLADPPKNQALTVRTTGGPLGAAGTGNLVIAVQFRLVPYDLSERAV